MATNTFNSGFFAGASHTTITNGNFTDVAGDIYNYHTSTSCSSFDFSDPVAKALSQINLRTPGAGAGIVTRASGVVKSGANVHKDKKMVTLEQDLRGLDAAFMPGNIGTTPSGSNRRMQEQNHLNLQQSIHHQEDRRDNRALTVQHETLLHSGSLSVDAKRPRRSPLISTGEDKPLTGWPMPRPPHQRPQEGVSQQMPDGVLRAGMPLSDFASQATQGISNNSGLLGQGVSARVEPMGRRTLPSPSPARMLENKNRQLPMPVPQSSRAERSPRNQLHPGANTGDSSLQPALNSAMAIPGSPSRMIDASRSIVPQNYADTASSRESVEAVPPSSNPPDSDSTLLSVLSANSGSIQTRLAAVSEIAPSRDLYNPVQMSSAYAFLICLLIMAASLGYQYY